MCGFAGVWRVDRSRAVEARELAPMLAELRWRGGDGERLVPGRGFGCAFARLALQDLRPEAMPPFVRGAWTLVANGELWDHERERARLEAGGERFATRSDQEVLAALVAQDEPLGPRVSGMYALAAYDAAGHRLVLERDPWGQKPLFHAAIPGGIAFASSLPALLAHPEVPRALDLASVAEALSYGFLPGVETPWRGVSRTDVGTRTVYDASTPEGRSQRHEEEPGARSSELGVRLAAAVRRQLATDRERALFLSGGIDSALVAAISRSQDARFAAVLTARFAGGGDESQAARETASALGLEIDEVSIDERALETLAPLTALAGEPLGDASLLSLHALARAARERGAAVAFTGDGADEWFLGYDRYRLAGAPFRSGALQDVERERDAPEGALGLARIARAWQQRRTSYPGLLRKISGASLHALGLSPEDHAAWCARQRALERRFEACGAIFDSTPPLAAARFDRRYYLPNGPLAKSDLACHAAQVEARAPFLDPEVVAAAPRGAAPWWRAGKRGLRALAREAGLPRSITEARKRGFRTPLRTWFKRAGGAARVLAPHRAAFERVFSWEPVAAWIAEEERGRRDHGARLYHVLATATFLERWA